jgi:hypothetical protein
MIRQFATEAGAELRRKMHPLRLRRYLASDLHPFMQPVAALATSVREHRAPAAPDNVFVGVERGWADGVEKTISLWRNLCDGWIELAFHTLYGSLAAIGVIGDLMDQAVADVPETASEPGVKEALGKVSRGGYPEAVVRMMIQLAQARGGVRRTRLARSNTLLQVEKPFADMTEAERQALIREQTVIVTMSPEESIATLPALLPTPAERTRALATVAGVAGSEQDLGEAAKAMLERQREVLGLA